VRTSEPSTATITTSDTRPVTTRLTNSIMACESVADSGVRLPGSQLGHSGHPRPDPVSRTDAPVTTMRARRTTATSAMRRYWLGLTRGRRIGRQS
jgi:hypothetical protein